MGDGAAGRPLKVFINYRRADTEFPAVHLYPALAERFGEENVFLDRKNLDAGVRWLSELRQHAQGCTAFLALIGPKWADSWRPLEEDFVRQEIELALGAARRNPGLTLIPVLVGLSVPPDPARLPQPVRPLLDRQLLHLRAEEWDGDVAALAARLEELASAPPPEQAPPEPPAPPVAQPPRAREYDEIAKRIAEGTVVPFLGPGANSSDRSERWEEIGCGYLPDAEELAAYLAERFDLRTEPGDLDLAQVSQLVAVNGNEGGLYQILMQTLAARCPPGSVHTFLAGLPRTLHDRGLPERYQLIVTTNYDDALEQAFQDAEEPFDLVVYMASDGGKFVHFPYEGGHRPIEVGKANEYTGFPIDVVSGELERTVIMKIHGAVDGERGLYSWQDNYVITEDHYIDYLSRSQVEAIVPQQIRRKLKYSHLLFLGYTMRDWNLRVFLHRMFGEKPLNGSWAVQREPDELDRRFWRRIGVECVETALPDFVGALELSLPDAVRA
jgi:hypothetical protein